MGRPGGGPGGGRGGPGGLNIGPPANPSPASIGWEWWKDADVAKQVGLRPDQASRIDRFYASRVKDIDPVVQEFKKERDTLDKMLADRTVDESTLNLQITKYNALNSTIVQSRYLMLYRISKVLEPDQYAKLQVVFQKRVQEFEQRRARGGGAPAPVPHSH
jgi:Spy/CpxP family protein refolding chaperone